MSTETRHSLIVGSGNSSRTIAIRKIAGRSPGLVWLGGFRSEMTGTKAQAMVDWARNSGHASLRFDYSGHGASGGEFTDGTISRWLEESLAVLGRCCKGPHVLIGSSMGGWIALRATQELAKSGNAPNLSGLLLIAPAPDFTKELMEPEFSDQQRVELETKGFISEESEYSDEPDIITKALIDDGRNNLVLDGIIDTGCPVHILQGMRDQDVPYQHAMRLLDHLPSQEVTLTLVKDGDHRLSGNQDIELMKRAIAGLVNSAGKP